MTDQRAARFGVSLGTGKGIAAVGTVSGFIALLAAAACCVLPLAFAAVGLGAVGLAFLVPYHWPLAIVALLAVATGWALYVRKRLACADGDDCEVGPPTRATFIMLSFATVFVLLSALWPGYIEAPLMQLMGGA